MTKLLLVAEQLRRPAPGGIGTYVRGLVLGMQRLAEDERPEATVFASKGPDPDPLAELGLPLVTESLTTRFLVAAWDKRLKPAPDHGYDVVHATSLAFPPTRAPLSLMIHDLSWRDVPDAFPRRGRKWHEAAFNRALATADRIVVPSRPIADQVLAAGGNAGRVEVIEHGADHLPPADNAAADAILERLGVIDGFILTVGTLEPRKNLPRLLEAYERARPELPEPWPLVVVGWEGWGDALGKKLPHGVVLAGGVEGAALAALYQRARCFVYVPVLEGFGLPPLEAMHHCTPVVASRIPSTGGAAIEVDAEDVSAIARAIVKTASDDRVRSELVTAGLLRAQELTWETTARRHAELWTSMA